jgi:formylglycine-generating enzyme required for sulfatase activity
MMRHKLVLVLALVTLVVGAVVVRRALRRSRAQVAVESLVRPFIVVPDHDWVHLPGGSFVVVQTRCEGGELRPGLTKGSPHRDTTQALPDLEFLRAPVTCDQFEACVVARRCRVQPGWRTYGCPLGPRARVPLQDAEDYCRWLHGRVPTLAELQRAIRGGSGDDLSELPPGDVCKRDCPRTTASGLLYFTTEEWTATVDCFPYPYSIGQRNVVMKMSKSRLDALFDREDFEDASVFRCLRDVPPSGTDGSR